MLCESMLRLCIELCDYFLFGMTLSANTECVLNLFLTFFQTQTISAVIMAVISKGFSVCLTGDINVFDGFWEELSESVCCKQT